MSTAVQIAPASRHLTYGLRSLFLLVTLVAIGFGYVAQWSHQRHELLVTHAIMPVDVVDLRPDYVTLFRQAMWLLGEEPVMALHILSPEISRDDVRWAFPEANIFIFPRPESSPNS